MTAGIASPKAKRKSGMTLVEVMIAMIVATVALLALLATAITAYKVNQKARLRDNARAVLRTYVDQFQRLAYAQDNVPRMIFNPTSGPTGLGLRWGQLSDQIEYEGAPTTMTVDIGSPGSAQNATVTRDVKFISINTGEVSGVRVADAAGFMLKATFTITYQVSGSSSTRSTVTQSMSTARLID